MWDWGWALGKKDFSEREMEKVFVFVFRWSGWQEQRCESRKVKSRHGDEEEDTI